MSIRDFIPQKQILSILFLTLTGPVVAFGASSNEKKCAVVLGDTQDTTIASHAKYDIQILLSSGAREWGLTRTTRYQGSFQVEARDVRSLNLLADYFKVSLDVISQEYYLLMRARFREQPMVDEQGHVSEPAKREVTLATFMHASKIIGWPMDTSAAKQFLENILQGFTMEPDVQKISLNLTRNEKQIFNRLPGNGAQTAKSEQPTSLQDIRWIPSSVNSSEDEGP